jgi:GxxExxY protein
MNDLEEIASAAIDCGLRVHKELGPGLLETVYEIALVSELSAKGLEIERQRPIPIVYRGMEIAEAFRADLIVDSRLVIEIKSIERNAPVHAKQLLTYLRMMKQPPLGCS